MAMSQNLVSCLFRQHFIMCVPYNAQMTPTATVSDQYVTAYFISSVFQATRAYAFRDIELVLMKMGTYCGG